MSASAHRLALGRAVRVVSSLTLVSRIAGLVRDLVSVRIFSDGVVGSAFAAAFAIPNMFRRLFGEGALSAAFIPEYARLSKDDPGVADAFGSLTIALVALVTLGMTAGIEIALAIVLATAPPDPDRVYSLALTMFLLPYAPLVCVAAMLAGMLQVHGRFAPGAAMPIILNFCIIAVAAPFFFIEDASARQWAWFIGASVLVSGVLQIAWSLAALRGLVRWKRGVAAAGAPARRMLLRLGPVLLGLGTLQVNALVDTLIAMWPNWVGPTIFGHPYPLDEASNGILFFTQRLYQFPLGVFGIAVATAIFPSLSRAADDRDSFIDLLRHGVRLSLFIALPASVGLALVSRDVVTVLYSGPGGGFSDEGVMRGSAVLVAYSVGIWAYSLNQLWTRSFYALGDTRTPMNVALLMVLLNFTLNIALVFLTPLREAALAWATAAAAIVQCLALPVLLSRRIDVRLIDLPTRGGLTRIFVLTLVMLGVVVGIQYLLPRPQAWQDWAWRLLITAGSGGLIYLGMARLLRIDELSWLLQRSAR
ncbi:MAG: murein biosynthesis integral membrane protein MurJ [Leptolyngbya sp. PLA3]|nr:MAG: murein biosynthesis integral membrane protein MurJ [Cyanobacteria bacterium CYA]MCE7969520.1 murein biosynthesis integral membrane protein MurJ [Leptolyngbya sp. PL-A3]